ncbi:MAG: hypothetical protein J5I59_07225 [Saprospiraceae bacterium]|nr:hypothetical protein [Saprospiraceae bacterium]
MKCRSRDKLIPYIVISTASACPGRDAGVGCIISGNIYVILTDRINLVGITAFIIRVLA